MSHRIRLAIATVITLGAVTGAVVPVSGTLADTWTGPDRPPAAAAAAPAGVTWGAQPEGVTWG